MNLTYTRCEEVDDGTEAEVTYEVEVDYAPGREPPAFDGTDATLCDPGDDEEFEILAIVRVNADGSREMMDRYHLDGDRDALREIAGDEWEPPERDEDEGSDR